MEEDKKTLALMGTDPSRLTDKQKGWMERIMGTPAEEIAYLPVRRPADDFETVGARLFATGEAHALVAIETPQRAMAPGTEDWELRVALFVPDLAFYRIAYDGADDAFKITA